MALAGLGLDLVILLLRGLSAGAPEAAPAGLGPDLVILLLRGLLAGEPQVAPAGLGLDISPPKRSCLMTRGERVGNASITDAPET